MKIATKRSSATAISMLVLSGLLLQSLASFSPSGATPINGHSQVIPSPIDTAVSTPVGTIIPPQPQADDIMSHLADASLPFVPNVGQFEASVLYAAQGEGFSVYLTEQEAVLSVVALADVSQTTLTPVAQPTTTYTQPYPTSTWTPTMPYQPATPSWTPTPQTPASTQSPAASITARIIQTVDGTASASIQHQNSDDRLNHGGFDLRSSELTPTPQTTAVLHIGLREANAAPVINSHHELQTRINYIYGSDQSQWHTNVPSYEYVTYKDVYPNIDQAWYGLNNKLEYDFIVAPNANPSSIKLGITGATNIEIVSGDLLIHTPVGDLRWPAPYIYQNTPNGTQHIEGEYVLLSDDEVGFSIANYDHSRELVIDPVAVDYSTYFGGTSKDWGYAIAVDAVGNAYIAGGTNSNDLPRPNHAYGGKQDAFVAKVNDSGTLLMFITYLGGSEDDWASGVTVDNSGKIYITGTTGSSGTTSGFPTTSNAFQTARVGLGSAAFITVFTANITSFNLLYSSYLSGSNYAISGNAIAADGSGKAVIVGGNMFGGLPVTPNAYQSSNGGSAFYSPFMSEFIVDGSASGGASLYYSSYLGATFQDRGTATGVALINGNIYLTGDIKDNAFPITANGFQTVSDCSGGFVDSFVTEINPNVPRTNALIYSTLLCGTDDDTSKGLVVAGNYVYITGGTASPRFPKDHYMNGYTMANLGGHDAFLVKLDISQPRANQLLYSTFLGGSDYDIANGLAVDTDGTAYITGETRSRAVPPAGTPFPTRYPITSGFAGLNEVFVAEIDTTKIGTPSLIYSTYFGGTCGYSEGGDAGSSIAVEKRIGAHKGSVYITGITGCADFPMTIGAPQQANHGGVGDAFVTKLSQDDDGDALPNWWEVYGVSSLYLPSMGADPEHKDIFIEVDAMKKGYGAELTDCGATPTGTPPTATSTPSTPRRGDYAPNATAVALVVKAFADATQIPAPSLTPGIALHVDNGPDSPMTTSSNWGTLSHSQHDLAFEPMLGSLSGGNYNWREFEAIRKTHFDDTRIRVFHYVIFAYKYPSVNPPCSSGISQGFIASNFLVALGQADAAGAGVANAQAGTLMHEFGHNLGLYHGGLNGDSINYKPNLLSIMNYSFQFSGLYKDGSVGTFDYSRFALPTLDENRLFDAVGLNDPRVANYGTTYYHEDPPGTPFPIYVPNANGPIAWDYSTPRPTATWVAADINQDLVKATMVSYDEWPNLVYRGGSIGWTTPTPISLAGLSQSGSDDTSGISPVEDARIPKPYKAVLNAPDGSEVNVGGQAIYQITVTNKGTNDDTYTTFVSSKHGWADASGVPASIFLHPQQQVSFTVTVNVPSNANFATDDFLDISVRGQHGAFDESIIHTIVHCPLSFTDVSYNYPLYGAINFVACHSIMSGFPNGDGTFSFQPSTNTTRAQLAKTIFLAYAIPAYTPTTPTFSDVPSNYFAYPFIEADVHAGVMSGFSPQDCVGPSTPIPAQVCFKPNQNATRVQTALVIRRAYGYPVYEPANPTFNDVQPTDFAYAAIETLAAKKVVSGSPCGPNVCFRPNENIRRDELAQIIYNTLRNKSWLRSY